MEQCLALDTLAPELRLFEIVLYVPYAAFVVTWILGFVHYDWALFLSNVLISYVAYVAILAIAPIIDWQSPRAVPCDSLLYQGYRYQWPCSACILWVAFGAVMFVHHLSRRKLWWPTLVGEAQWRTPRRILFVLTLALPPILHALFLLVSEIQSPLALLANWLTVFGLAILVRTIIPSDRVARRVWQFFRHQLLPHQFDTPSPDDAAI